MNKITIDLKKQANYKNASVSVFYTGFWIPVCRLKEVYTLKFKNHNKLIDNYIDWTTHELVFNDYKTKKLYGMQKVKISSYMENLFLKLISSYDNTDNDYLFVKKSYLPYNEVDFSKLVVNIFGVSVNKLRSMYITDNFNKGLLNTEQQKIEFSQGLRNSPDVFKYYIKFVGGTDNIVFV